MGINKTDFIDIITKPIGQHWADQFLFLKNLPTPYLDNVSSFGLNIKSSKFGMDQQAKDVVLPSNWLPMGTTEDKERYDRLFTPERIMERTTDYFGDGDAVQFVQDYVTEIKKIAKSINVGKDSDGEDIIVDIYDENDMVTDDFFELMNEYKRITTGKKQGAKGRFLQEMGLLTDELYKKYMKSKKGKGAKNTVQSLYRDIPMQSQGKKVLHSAIDTRKALESGQNIDPYRFYSALSVLFLNTKGNKFQPRDLFGSSEKTEKSDGSKAVVKVIYLSPAKRSDRAIPDEWLEYFHWSVATDAIADRQGYTPIVPQFPDSELGRELQQKYDNAKRMYDSKGYSFYKNNPRQINLCPNPNTCPYAAGCAGLCLVDSGQMKAAYEPMAAGFLKTWYFFIYPLFFLRQLIVEIRNNSLDCYRDGMTFFARLNGTSDIPWERYFNMDSLVETINYECSIGQLRMLHPDDQLGSAKMNKYAEKRAKALQDSTTKPVAMGGFYDYNKYPYEDRKKAGDWANYGGKCPTYYDLTFSISESIVSKSSGCFVGSPFATSIEDALEWIQMGFRVATVVEFFRYVPYRQITSMEERFIQAIGEDLTLDDVIKALKTTTDPLEYIDLVHLRELFLFQLRNKKAGQDLKIPIEIFTKVKSGNDYVFDSDGYFKVKIEKKKVSVPDFNTLARTAINSLDQDNRGRNIMIIDGDETDFRFSDPKPSIVILKPKGISVVQKGKPKYDRDEKDMGDGAVYNSKPYEDQDGRYFNKFSALEQSFIMTGETVLMLQDLFMNVINKQRFAFMMEDVAKALDMKGNTVYAQNIKESIPPELHSIAIDECRTATTEHGALQILSGEPKNLVNINKMLASSFSLSSLERPQDFGTFQKDKQTVARSKRTKANPSIVVHKHNNSYILVFGNSVLDINGVYQWKTLRKLEDTLHKHNMYIDQNYIVRKG